MQETFAFPLSPPTDTVAALGELETLRRIVRRLPRSAAELLGPGDDAAVVAAPDGRTVVTTDMMIQGPDFRLAWSSPYELGWKAAVSNLADVAAMGAIPTALLVALAAPSATPVATLEGFADGMRDACEALAPGCGVVGGDLSTSDALTIAVTAFGDLGGHAPVLRSGARPADDVAIAGPLGLAGAGIWLLYRDGSGEPDAAGRREPDAGRGQMVRQRHPALVGEQVAPSSPIALGVVAREAGATAMLDVSDGLVLDASRIANASGVTIELSEQAIAAEAAALVGVDAVVGERARDFVLAGGEDHSLLATFPAGGVPDGFRVIGRVHTRAAEGGASTAGAADAVVTVGGVAYARPGGWDPYADWDGAAG
ncbi:thiamine-phosphate kinase [Agreia sp. COWG]|uniref:thiamine-phosphate kinase n=1 Tax=Agreia sp. COWG TaxID=2773266 RepID=UPI001926A105|nr:thiamine-phosphate kinase [Agreia sp. COWG]CAD5994318.1 Thiamine-monophosphate kinase [Agreia sp. COWG]